MSNLTTTIVELYSNLIPTGTPVEILGASFDPRLLVLVKVIGGAGQTAWVPFKSTEVGRNLLGNLTWLVRSEGVAEMNAWVEAEVLELYNKKSPGLSTEASIS